jgi:hypothetical protein
VGGDCSRESKKFPVTFGFLEKLVRRKYGDIQMHEDLKVKLPRVVVLLKQKLAFQRAQTCDVRRKYYSFLHLWVYTKGCITSSM